MVNYKTLWQVQGSGMIKAMSMIIKTKNKNDHACCYSSIAGIAPTYRMKDSVICCTDTYIAKYAFHFAAILLKVCIKIVSEGTRNYMYMYNPQKHPPPSHLACIWPCAFMYTNLLFRHIQGSLIITISGSTSSSSSCSKVVHI